MAMSISSQIPSDSALSLAKIEGNQQQQAVRWLLDSRVVEEGVLVATYGSGNTFVASFNMTICMFHFLAFAVSGLPALAREPSNAPEGRTFLPGRGRGQMLRAVGKAMLFLTPSSRGPLRTSSLWLYSFSHVSRGLQICKWSQRPP